MEQYYRPATTAEAIVLLEKNQGNARVIAGGTDLMLQLRQRRLAAMALVDLNGVDELKHICEADGWIKIGAMTTHSAIAASPLIRQKARVLAEAAQSIGSPQIRNVATIGGNVVNAQPAADTTIALMALDCRVRILTFKGEEIRPLEQLFLGAGKSTVDSTREIVLGFEFPTPGRQEATAFMRHAKRRALALPITNVGVWLRVSEDSTRFEDIRIALGPMAPVPLQATAAAEALRGSEIQERALAQAAAALAHEVKPRDSIRGSAAYKREMAKVLFRRAVLSALGDLGGGLNG